jgi:hypothetical protein
MFETDRVAVHVRYKDIRRVTRQLLPNAIRARATTVGDPARTRQAMKLRAPAAF